MTDPQVFSRDHGLNKENLVPPYLAWLVRGAGGSLLLLGFLSARGLGSHDGLVDGRFQDWSAALGNLSAFYFYSYVVMQIPTGILSDAKGRARRSPAFCDFSQSAVIISDDIFSGRSF